jgi:hypothetical protein
MDDPYFDHKSAKRFDRQRALSGPFGVDELTPKKMSTWDQRKHPETGKKQVLLNFVDWQRSQAARIISDFELYVYEWTLTTVKHRESLDKQGKREIAQAIFAPDRNGRLIPFAHELRSLEFAPDGDAEADARGLENLQLLRINALVELIENDDNGLVEADRPALKTCLEMTQTEFALFETLVRVFDHARSHFISEICEPSVKRLLNAIRIRVEENEDRMPFSLYKSTLLGRMQNSSVIDGLLSYILKPRENNCTLSLWVAERVAEKKLLKEDGIEMGEDTWLELILSFVTTEEKQTLRVPARAERAEFNENDGYGVPDLQEALASCDPNNFKRFRQTNCYDPVALRVLSLDRLVQQTAGATKTKKTAPLEVNLLHKPEDTASGARADKAAPLPLKAGRPDPEVYAKFPEKSLRRRLWNAIVTKKCVRCTGDHLRSACPKERQPWEDDFERPDFWTKKAPVEQVRVQLNESLNTPCPTVLHVVCSFGICLIDTCSDVSLARREVLREILEVDEPVVINHLGGETRLHDAGSFTLESLRDSHVALQGVFAVNSSELPAGAVALLGVADVRLLGLSLDRIADDPGCHWEDARLRRPPRSVWSRLCGPWTGWFRSRSERRDVPRPVVFAPPDGPAQRLYPQPPRQRDVAAQVPRSIDAVQREVDPEARGAPAPFLPPSFLQELKEHNRREQERKLTNRVGRLFLESPPARKKSYAAPSHHAPPKPESQSSSSAGTITSCLPRRGKSSKFYAVRVGRRPSVYESWAECRAMLTVFVLLSFRRFLPDGRQRSL